MSQPQRAIQIHSYALTDRGLNERRPLNEDSYLADDERCIFAVADGVGGAEAGEVASQTAVEVIDEAFRHLTSDADIEDLMELAIQRANASIHQMAKEHAKFSMMATTIVALHLNGNIATIGHVGDSRLYRLTPDGLIIRETADHSIVEEEVRAGRMTRDQAANHPSRNVISRALGAEDNVEVDLKTIEVKDGTSFLLCTDGITRHIPDNELGQLLAQQNDLATLCAELKRICYERGAEDNLTAVIVHLGDGRARPAENAARTAASEPGQREYAPSVEAVPEPAAGNLDQTEDALVPPSRIAFPAVSVPEEKQPIRQDRILTVENSHASRGGFGKAMARIFVFLLILAGLAAAFYAGTRYKGQLPFGETPVQPTPQPSPTHVAEDPLLRFERARREIDKEPSEWLKNEVKQELARQGLANPLDSTDPEFLYLYGRASLLSGNNEEASKAFEQAIARADRNPSPSNSTVRKEATLALAAVTLKSNKVKWPALNRFDEMVRKPANTNSP
jgi:serine/threonine protein phosphatase PrpC